MKNSILCIKYFDEKFILRWEQNKQNWDLHPIPTIYSEKVRKPSLLLTSTELRKPLKLQWIIHQPDKLQDFLLTDMRKDFNHLEEEMFRLNDFEFKKIGRLYFNL